MVKRSKHTLYLGLLLLGILSLYIWLLSPDIVGAMYDDGIYFLAAKALKQGIGYRILHILGAPPLYKYPPLFPTFLAGILSFTIYPIPPYGSK